MRELVARIEMAAIAFYCTWLGTHRTTLCDLSNIFATNLVAPAGGPRGALHGWGESFSRYYRSDDAWVARRHAQMFTDGNVDALILAATNAMTYDRTTDLLASTLAVWGTRGRPSRAMLRILDLCPQCWNLLSALWPHLSAGFAGGSWAPIEGGDCGFSLR